MIKKTKVPFDFKASINMKEWRNDFKSSIIELDLDFFLFHQEKKKQALILIL